MTDLAALIPASLTGILAGEVIPEAPMPATQQPLSDLPFVRANLGQATRLWVVEATGSWGDDCLLGREYADLLLAYIETNRNHPLLGLVCRAMAQTGAWGGIETGFFQRISERAAG